MFGGLEYSIVYSICELAFDFFFFKQKTAYEMRISDWSSDVCSSDLHARDRAARCARESRTRLAGTTGSGCSRSTRTAARSTVANARPVPARRARRTAVAASGLAPTAQPRPANAAYAAGAARGQ